MLEALYPKANPPRDGFAAGRSRRSEDVWNFRPLFFAKSASTFIGATPHQRPACRFQFSVPSSLDASAGRDAYRTCGKEPLFAL